MKTLAYIIGLGYLLGLGMGSALGQGIESCTQCVCVADNTCDESSTCGSSEVGCGGQSFTADCSGTYKLKYVFSCSGDTCEQCYACVYLVDGSGNFLAAAHSSCNSRDCEGLGDTYDLVSGHQYKLYVCKKVCPGGSCDDCTGCVARGYIFRNSFSLDCNVIPACNP